ncbi:MAG: SHOCT domain-containing protein [Chloroflexi bacterium]|nr:SHOCT domain-containing protein [Chloroflexota bacterium]MDA8236888.1 SHOCT domain-containing protein [Chloroflexota bacterium]
MMAGWGWGMGLGGWLWMIIGVIALVAIVWAIASAGSSRDRSAVNDAAEALRLRFARGEITEAEYQQARRLLGV